MAMYLTLEEQEMLDGKRGPLTQKCMKVLVTLGEIYGAKRMVKVKNVHFPGVSYRVAGDAGLEYVCDASEQGSFCVPSTLNTIGIDCFDMESLQFDKDFCKGQLKLNEAYEKMGAIPTYTCTPYDQAEIRAIALDLKEFVKQFSETRKQVEKFFGMRAGRGFCRA